MIRSYRCLLVLAAFATAASSALGENFALQIASPVAGQGAMLKSASFVFRSTGCTEMRNFQVTAKAEGMVDGERKTLPLETFAAPAPGVFAVFKKWPAEGTWIVALSATCGPTLTAGALVAIAPGRGAGPDRKNSKFLPNAPAEAEIVAALKAVSALPK
jgi:hypothetical protein